MLKQPYEIMLFDLDDTLLDFKAAEKDALKALFACAGIPDTETSRERYRTINTELWEMHEKNLIPREQVLNSRFEILWGELGVKGDGEELEAFYRERLNEGAQLIPGAAQVCRTLMDRGHRLIVVSNGVAATQRKRLAASGLNQLIKEVFVSEAVGYHKPEKEFFDHVFKEASVEDLSKVIIIGDSLTSDIKGGINAGIDTCWFNPRKLANLAGILPTFEIASLEELL